MSIKDYFKTRYMKPKQEPTISEDPPTSDNEAIKQELSSLVPEELVDGLLPAYTALKATEGAEALVELLQAQKASLDFLEENQDTLVQKTDPNKSDDDDGDSEDESTVDHVMNKILSMYGD